MSKAKHAKPLPPRRVTFPKHLAEHAEEWRAKKRTEWRAVMAALDKFRYGSAYVPDTSRLWELYKEAERYQVEIEVEEWVAW